MKKLPLNEQNFKTIIDDGFLYIDKTRQIYEMIDGGRLYFLSRPRRFGKTLVTSVLEHLFGGTKDLFKGLYIAEQTDWEWKKSPVLSFNFAKLGHEIEDLEDVLNGELDTLAAKFSIVLEKTRLADRVNELVSTISIQQSAVVVLVDEYDKPIIDFLTQAKKAKTNRKVLRKFFSAFKDLNKNGHLRFLFVTGVSKFNKVSLFSDLNNLTDLTIDPISHDLVGITNEEIDFYLKEHIEYAAQRMDLTPKEVRDGIKLWYDGYSYDGQTFLYNPISLFNFLKKYRFGNFWFETGTPTFLVETIRNKGIKPEKVENRKVSETFFNKFTIKHLDIHGLLFQTGYLTIKSVYRVGLSPRYVLGYPNEEVRISLVHNLLEVFTYQPASIVSDAMIKMEEALTDGQVKGFVKQLKVLLSDLSYHFMPRGKKKNATAADKAKLFKAWEGYFQTIIYLVSSFLNFNVQAEITKHKGRLDVLIESEDFLYLIELKLNENAKLAVKQIKNRKYAAAYYNSPKTVFLVGISFSEEERNVKSWKAVEWKRR